MVMMSQIKGSKKLHKDMQPAKKPSGPLTGKTNKTGKITSMTYKGGQATVKKGMKTTAMPASAPGSKPTIKSTMGKNKVIARNARKANVSTSSTAPISGFSKDLSNRNKYAMAKQNVAAVYARRAKQGL